MSQSDVSPSAPVHDGASGTEEHEPKLWVELGIDVASTTDCPLGRRSARGWNGTVQLVGSTCHLSLKRNEEAAGEPRSITTSVSDMCVCPALCGDGFSPVELTVEDGSLVVGAYAVDRETLSEVSNRLDDGVERWRLRQLASTTGDSRESDVAGRDNRPPLTEKQRKAVAVAVTMGYYDSPRRASLGDLSDRLGVSRSALSQRLNAVESKLINDLSRHL